MPSVSVNGQTIFLLSGAGTPYGTVVAEPGALYYDTLNTVAYINSDGTATGWQVV